MKKLFLIITLSSSFTPVFSQQGKNSHEVIDLNKRAVELNIRNLSNKDSTEKVLDLLDKAIALDRNYLVSYDNKINVLLFEKRYDDAIKTIDEAIEYNPKAHGFYLLKAKALEEKGQPGKALFFYKKALETSETEMKENPTTGAFIDRYFLKYCIYGTDTPADKVTAAIPDSFTDEQRKAVTGFFEMFGSFKKFKDGFVKNGSLPLSQNKSPMPQKREDGAYYTADEMAEFPGGQDAMTAFICENFRRPANCRRGTVLVNFVVEADGTIRDAVIKRSVDKEADNEALRVVNMMPEWKPAKVNGKAVAMVYNIPFTVE